MPLHERRGRPLIAIFPPLNELGIRGLSHARVSHSHDGRRGGPESVKVRCATDLDAAKMTTSSGTRRNVERIGHRGAPRRYLENTTPAFQEALRLGADAVELDVHVTADGLPVVHHDPVLSARVKPASLVRKPINSLESSAIASV